MRNATRIVASSFGILAGLAGVDHGIGETLQGNIAPGGIMIESWPGSALLRSLGGEPAMTLVPNLLVTGVLAIVISLVLAANQGAPALYLLVPGHEVGLERNCHCFGAALGLELGENVADVKFDGRRAND